MAYKVFISFRFSDGEQYKDELSKLFSGDDDVINCSENEDRSNYTDDTIRSYLYEKLKRTSVTIVLLTPEAVNHKKDWLGRYDDWMHDEIRYSLEDRGNNRPNGLIAVYTPEAKNQILLETKCYKCSDECPVISINDFDNLVRRNMMNVKDEYKVNPCDGIYNLKKDSYCSLVSWEDFTNNYDSFIESAEEKRDNIDHYTIKKNLNK